MDQAELSGKIVKNVGWLDGAHPFLQGVVSAEVIASLEQLVIHTWKPPFMASGWHGCNICPRKPPEGPIMRDIGGQSIMLGAMQIYVPDGDIMYSAPNLILHYIEDHGHGPPEVFLQAMCKIDPQAPARTTPPATRSPTRPAWARYRVLLVALDEGASRPLRRSRRRTCVRRSRLTPKMASPILWRPSGAVFICPIRLNVVNLDDRKRWLAIRRDNSNRHDR
jgi:hypothetical protein